MNYVTNDQLIEEYRNCKKQGRLTEKMAEYLYMISDRYSRHHWFVGYSYREDLVAAGVLALVKVWDKFDPDKLYGTEMVDGELKQKRPNAFSFYTQCCYYAFRDFLREEKLQADIRDSLLIDMGYTPRFNHEQEDE